MTVSTATYLTRHVGDGSTTSFATDFKFRAGADLVVTLWTAGLPELQTLGADYTVTGAGATLGGSVAFGVAPTAGQVVTLERATDDRQTSDYTEQDGFPEQTIEEDFDRLSMLTQELAGRLAYTLRLPAGADGLDEAALAALILPAAPIRRGGVLRFADTDAAEPIIATGIPDVSVSGALAPVVQAASIAAALGLLGLTATGPVIWGRKAIAGAGVPQPLTPAEAMAELPALITDTGTVAGSKGAAPAPAAGDAARRRVLTPLGWQDRESLARLVVPSFIQAKAADHPNRADIFPVACRGSGLGSVRMTKTPDEYWHGEVLEYEGDDSAVWIDALNGNDTLSGADAAHPVKTWQQAVNIAEGRTIIPLPTTVYPPFTFDGTATVGFFKRIMPLYGPLIIREPGPDISTLTWTADTNGVWVADLSGDLAAGQLVQRVYRRDGVKDSWGRPDRQRHYFDVADIRADGMTQRGVYHDADNQLLYMCFEGLSLETYKAKFRALFTNSDGAAALVLYGGVNLFLDGTVQPILLDGVAIPGFAPEGSPTSLPTFLAQGRVRCRFPLGEGVNLAGGLTYTSGLSVYGSRFDGGQGDPGLDGSDAMVIHHDYTSLANGDLVAFANDPALVQNRDGFSAHGGCNVIMAGALLGGNYGKGQADTTAAGFDNFSWCIGVETVANGPESPGLGFYSAPETGDRQVWTDACRTVGEARGTGYGPLYAENMTVYDAGNSDLNQPRQVGGTGAFAPYARSAPG